MIDKFSLALVIGK